MNPVLFAGRLGDDERRLRAAFGWMSGLDPSLLAWDTGIDPVSNLHGAATDDGTHAWEVLFGTWRRSGGTIQRTSGSDLGDAAVVDVGTGNVVVAADLVSWHSTGDRDTGIVARAVPEEDAWLIASVRTTTVISNTLRLEKKVGDQRTLLSSVVIPEPYRVQPIRLWVWAQENFVTVGMHGVPILRYELQGDDLALFSATTATRHGLGTRFTVTPGTTSWRNLAIWRCEM